MDMQIRNGFAYRKHGEYTKFMIQGKAMYAGNTFTLIHNNKTCGISPLTRVFRCDNRNKNTLRILDKHGRNQIKLLFEEIYKFRIVNANEDCWAAMKSPMACIKQPTNKNPQLYGWVFLKNI